MMKLVKLTLSLALLFAMVHGVAYFLPLSGDGGTGTSSASAISVRVSEDKFVAVLAAALPGENAKDVVIGGSSVKSRTWRLPMPLAQAADLLETQYSNELEKWRSEALGTSPGTRPRLFEDVLKLHRLDTSDWVLITLPLVPQGFNSEDRDAHPSPGRSPHAFSLLLSRNAPPQGGTTVATFRTDLATLTTQDPDWLPEGLGKFPGQVEMVRYRQGPEENAPRIVVRFQTPVSKDDFQARVELLKRHAQPFSITSRDPNAASLRLEGPAGLSAEVRYAVSKNRKMAMELLVIQAKETGVGRL
jgi:hypothetical protein